MSGLGISPLLAALVPLALVVYTLSRSRRTRTDFPDGPKPLPLIGNALQLAQDPQLWLTAHAWARQYGTMTYTHVFGMSLVFLNTHEAAVDLLDRKGSIYSDKPRLVMAGELCGCQNMAAFTRYGDQFRRQRRIMQRALNPQAVTSYEPLIRSETRSFLRRLIRHPDHRDVLAQIKRYAGQLTLSTVYGYRVSADDDPFLKLADECVDLLAQKIASGGGVWPVDVLPILQHLPTWFPGASFKHNAIIWKSKMESFVEKPWEWLKLQVARGTAKPSFCSTLLLDDDKNDTEFDIKWTANSMYSASIDTTATAIMFVLLALTMHPDVLAKAQAEIDKVTGGKRLPEFSDREDLPYVQAVMLETLRWGVPVPLGLPHRLMEDDVYEGKFIPAGSLVFPNIWNMMRDPDVFTDPDTFDPDRYMSPSSLTPRTDPRNFIFGFGRRGCPGRHLFDASGWFLTVSIIATLDIRALPGRPPKVEFEGGVFRMPKTFECAITPRSRKALDLLIQDGEVEAANVN